VKDLLDNRSDKDKLFDWMKSRSWTRTSDVIKWGSQNYSNRAERNARALAAEGKIRRMTDEEKKAITGILTEDVWITNPRRDERK